MYKNSDGLHGQCIGYIMYIDIHYCLIIIRVSYVKCIYVVVNVEYDPA